jgi:hypothetical protein
MHLSINLLLIFFILRNEYTFLLLRLPQSLGACAVSVTFCVSSDGLSRRTQLQERDTCVPLVLLLKLCFLKKQFFKFPSF